MSIPLQRRRASARRAFKAVLTVAVVAALAPQAASASLSGAGPVDPATGFPSYYQDANGLRLGLCIADPGCPSSPAAADFVSPDGEAFYQLAGATVTSGSRSVSIDFNLEGAFLDPGPGQQITFGRVQVGMTGMVPNSTYTITHPYGSGTWTTDGAGAILGNNRTQQRHEVGCAGPPCDFTAAFGTEIGPFLQWDPAESSPPPGYVGDGVTPHRVIGGAINTVTVEGPGLPAGGISTDRFVVEGKLAGAPVPVFSAAGVAYGHQQLGTTSTRTVTVKNNTVSGGPDLTIGSVGIGGAHAADFTRAASGGTCAAGTTSLAPGQTCTVNVTFAPGGPGARSATLDVGDNAGGSPHHVALSGFGFTPAVPVYGISPTQLDFGNQATLTGSILTLTIRNDGDPADPAAPGSSDMAISGVGIAGANAADFAITSSTCPATLVAGATCAVSVRFTPAAPGQRSAHLTTGDSAGGPHSVPLKGTAIGATGGISGGASGVGSVTIVLPSAVGAPAAARPTLRGLTAGPTIRVKKLKRSGLRLSMSVGASTATVRVAVYRVVRGRRAGRPLYRTVRLPDASRRYAVTLTARAIRGLKPGLYEVTATPAGGGDELGSTTRLKFRVVR